MRNDDASHFFWDFQRDREKSHLDNLVIRMKLLYNGNRRSRRGENGEISDAEIRGHPGIDEGTACGQSAVGNQGTGDTEEKHILRLSVRKGF